MWTAAAPSTSASPAEQTGRARHKGQKAAHKTPRLPEALEVFSDFDAVDVDGSGAVDIRESGRRGAPGTKGRRPRTRRRACPRRWKSSRTSTPWTWTAAAPSTSASPADGARQAQREEGRAQDAALAR